MHELKKNMFLCSKREVRTIISILFSEVSNDESFPAMITDFLDMKIFPTITLRSRRPPCLTIKSKWFKMKFRKRHACVERQRSRKIGTVHVQQDFSPPLFFSQLFGCAHMHAKRNKSYNSIHCHILDVKHSV